MKIIKNYKELTKDLSLNAKKIIYSNMHDKKYQKRILNLLPKGKSVWIDSNGESINDNIITFENHKWKGIFKSNTIKYYKDFFSKTLNQTIKKYINPQSIVMYNSCELKYINENKLIDIINFLINSYNTKLIIYVDIIFIDYNKLKYSVDHIIKKIENKIKHNCKKHKLDNFKYIFEIE